MLVLTLISPLFIVIIFLLKLTAEGEIFYLQERVGFNNKTFKIYKFATMLKNSSNMKGGYITLKNDYRVTFIGNFLRKTKINELPQLLNVISGKMSVVGPRPVMQVSFDSYPLDIQKLIYNEKPGLTGIGSIVFRDEESLITDEKKRGGDVWEFYKKKIYPYKGSLEIWYQKNKSFKLDFKLILITVWVIISPNTNIVFRLFKDLPKRNF